MSPRLLGAIVDCAIPLVGGLYAILLGHRKVGRPPGENVKYDAWIERYGGFLRSVGPLLVAWAVVRLLFAVFVHA